MLLNLRRSDLASPPFRHSPTEEGRLDECGFPVLQVADAERPVKPAVMFSP